MLNEVFRFGIGEIVTLRVGVLGLECEAELNAVTDREYRRFERYGAPRQMLITGRRIDECHGGVQLVYLVNGMDNVAGPAHMIFEFQLAPLRDAMAVLHQMKEAQTDSLKKRERATKAGDSD